MIFSWIYRRRFLAAVFSLGFLFYVFPLINFALQKGVQSYVLRNYALPQFPEGSANVNSRLVALYKDVAIRKTLDPSRPALLVFGNSRQFHIRRELLERAFGCKVSNFYNLTYPGAEAYGGGNALLYYESLLKKGSTVIIGTGPIWFQQIARQQDPALDVPWTSVGDWFQNLRDGNGSISNLYPELVLFEWPQKKLNNFPFVQYYSDIIEWSLGSFLDQRIDQDGSIYYLLAEPEHQQRIRSGQKLDVQNMKRVLQKAVRSPLIDHAFESFEDAMIRLTQKGISVVGIETVTHPEHMAYYRSHEVQYGRYYRFMKRLERELPGYSFVPIDALAINVPDYHWIDSSHITFESAHLLVENLSGKIAKSAVCL